MSTEPRLAQKLANAISVGEYRPGEWLKQINLASRFDATRFEVRRALEELTLRGSVSHVRQKGYHVSVPSDSDLSHSRVVRIILETEAAKMALRNITDKDVEELARLAENFWKASETGSLSERSQAGNLFHDTMYGLAGNPMLSDLIKEVRDRSRGTPIYLWTSVQSMRRSAQEHDDIVDALRTRDPEAVAEAVRRHLAHESGPR